MPHATARAAACTGLPLPKKQEAKERATLCNSVRLQGQRPFVGRTSGVHRHSLPVRNRVWDRLGRQRTLCAATVTEREGLVVVTREKGKNDDLIAALQAQQVNTLELPLIEATSGPDRSKLPTALQQEEFDWIVVTSPEAAAVFIEGWREADKPFVRVAAVGEGTGKVLDAQNEPILKPLFYPSKANAAHLSVEMPAIQEGSMRVLYPASAKASTELQDGLASRGFVVERLNTYNTLPVGALSPQELDHAKAAAVVAFASPSAVKAWMALVGKADVAAACIGSTSARAAESAGLQHIFFPEEPGMRGFVNSIMEALQARQPSSAAH